MSTNKLSLLLAALVAVAPGFALAQHGAPPAGHGGMPPGHGGMMGGGNSAQQQMMMAQMRVIQAQQKALADPAIQKELSAVQTAVEAEMVKVDASLAPKIKRFHQLEDELKALTPEQKKDAAKVQPLMQELQKLGMELGQGQQKVLGNAALKAKVEAFEKKVQAKMAEIDPEVPKLIEQLKAGQPAAGH